MNTRTGTMIVLARSTFFACTSFRKSSASNTQGLKDYYKAYFPVGNAVAPRMLHGEDSRKFIAAK